VGVIVMAVFAPLLAPYDPNHQNISRRFAPPMSAPGGDLLLLGADALGRDILSRIIFGAQISLIVGIGAVLVQGGLGVLLGLLAGYYRRLDNLIMRVADVQLGIPFFVLALAVIAVLGPGLTNIIIVLGLTGWVIYARVVRGEVLSVRRRDYVDAARIVGVPDWRIIARHILPNVSSSIIVIATLEVARMIIAEASLSFLGLGVQPPTPTWGGMVADGRNYISVSWWVSTFPGLAILVTALGINLLGDWLRDTLDPGLRL
jgi:peptide/nickel transport system permease protein